MTDRIEVILLEDIQELGKEGDIVQVSEGHARNFLFPQGKAAIATEGLQKKHEENKKVKNMKREQELESKQQQAETLDGTELTLTAQVKEGEDIFGSITAKNIADNLRKQANIKIKANDIELEKPITKLGSHTVVVRLSPDVEAKIQVTIEPDANSSTDTDENEE